MMSNKGIAEVSGRAILALGDVLLMNTTAFDRHVVEQSVGSGMPTTILLPRNTQLLGHDGEMLAAAFARIASQARNVTHVRVVVHRLPTRFHNGRVTLSVTR